MNWRYWLIGALVIAVLVAAIYFPVLKRRLSKSAQVPEKSAEEARRELAQPSSTGAGEPIVKVKLFWSSGAEDGSLTPVRVDLPLSKDPVVRAKQVLNTLLAGPTNFDLRTVPPDAVLLAFYLLPDGTGIADFSEALSTSTPSGVQSEQMAVDSINQTLAANVPQVRWLKILIHGQGVETLAGHIDLTRTFLVNANAVPVAPGTNRVKPGTSPEAPETPKSRTILPKSKAEKLTPVPAPGKLAQPTTPP
jgi:Sporulation and spore germination